MQRSDTPQPPPGDVITFAFPGPLRDKLVAAVLSGKKTATTGLAIEWEVEGEALPVVGQRHTVVDSSEQPVGVIETTLVEVIRLGDADWSLARDEGEDFEDVAQWRVAHERFWTHEVIPTLPAGTLSALTDDTQVLVWRFRLA
ncbi:ASCH domain-containing protein [Solirubrobacter phytolaccae]|uniref:ASCH domain-containing protein n=1 Tax=Solirubrobacter phytolaccae TaxID=1404360 RepID=A0A9X3NCJ5_9ACTN|nr:ASCH domain-containing protein [Solirubrobacter phytolaccae]MDA0183973.1 ASCH domain-containing protein [Solirubrobacter phytolaccae]